MGKTGQSQANYQIIRAIRAAVAPLAHPERTLLNQGNTLLNQGTHLTQPGKHPSRPGIGPYSTGESTLLNQGKDPSQPGKGPFTSGASTLHDRRQHPSQAGRAPYSTGYTTLLSHGEHPSRVGNPPPTTWGSTLHDRGEYPSHAGKAPFSTSEGTFHERGRYPPTPRKVPFESKERALHDLGERPYRDVATAQRADADYFQPPKWRALDKLKRLGGKPLREYCKSCRDLFQPGKAAPTLMVCNFDLNYALQPHLDDQLEPVPAAEIGSTKKKLRSGDLVASRLRSYLKEIAIVPRTDGAPCVGSTEFIVLRPKPNCISVEAALVFLLSHIVQTILHWSQDGSDHPRLAESELLNIIIPDSLLKIQERIAKQVRASAQAIVESRCLLEKVKRAVEEGLIHKRQ